MNKLTIIGGILMFTIGLMASSVLPIESVRYPYSTSSESTISPSDSISKENIHLFNDRLVIEEEGLIYASVKDTHSMEPLINVHSTSIEKKPTTPDVLVVGDIVSYQLVNSDKIIIHRIMEISEDSEGWYAITKGDNNNNPDAEKVRFDQIKGKVVGIIY